ncbi:hypothetical protein OX462_07170 [Janthinobacterium sp. SUN098]|uniref:hypothetical protein n=1 Tax=unclassified Janthinobacterium TaxID=2610881 RepID=UPI0020C74F15|nr:hypothetical protein [Janthinobacterium sp. HH106]
MRALIAVLMSLLLGACATPPLPEATVPRSGPFMAQVVGLQWLNPLQRKDYPTQWQLLWTLGLTQPNPNDEMVREKPEKYSKLQSIASIAVGNNGSETFRGYHHKYIEDMFDRFHGVYSARWRRRLPCNCRNSIC